MDTKEQIITEYLGGGISYELLGKKHGFAKTTVRDWVAAYLKVKESSNFPIMKKSKEDIPAEVVELQKQLAQEKLRNKLLTAMIDIAEEELKIPIRKKYGARQLKK
jgi:transposase-like protein